MSNLIVASLLAAVLNVQPGEYTDKGLCDLWAGAQCHAATCEKDSKARCGSASAHCKDRGAAAVPASHSEKVAACAKALLKARCGDPQPSECAGVGTP